MSYVRLQTTPVPVKSREFNDVRSPARIPPTMLSSYAGISAIALFLLPAAATLTIWIRDPLAAWGYEFLACGLGAACCLRAPHGWSARGIAASAIALWGLGQFALDATVYRPATLEPSPRFAALAAPATAASFALQFAHIRKAFLHGFACFGFVVAVLAVLEYHTSGGRVYWIFPSGYPAVGGPFLSRNNFSEFLELALPVALWISVSEKRPVYTVMASAMLAAGIASASRAGSVLL